MHLGILQLIHLDERVYPCYLFPVKKIYCNQISLEYHVPEFIDYNEKFFWSSYPDKNLVYGIRHGEDSADAILDDFES